VRLGRVADLDAVQLGGRAGSDRYTGQRRLMTAQKITNDGTRQVSPDFLAPVVSLDSRRANGFVAAGVEKCWSQVDDHEMHDVYIVISEVGEGEHVARTIYAGSADDARQTHHENYPDEPIVAVHQ
jgi:hypothetical protein